MSIFSGEPKDVTKIRRLVAPLYMKKTTAPGAETQ